MSLLLRMNRPFSLNPPSTFSSTSRRASSVVLSILLFCRFVVHLVGCPFSVPLPLRTRLSFFDPPFLSLVLVSLLVYADNLFVSLWFVSVFVGIPQLRRRADAFFCCLDGRSRRPSSSFPRQSILDPVRFNATWQ